MRMSQVKLNVEYTEHNGIYSIKLGNKIVDIDQTTFIELTKDTSMNGNDNYIFNKDLDNAFEQAYQNFDTSFYSANSSEW